MICARVDGAQVAQGRLERTATVGYSMDETFDIGWDKASPVSEEYGPIAHFTGKISRVEFDSQPDLDPDHDDHHAAGTAAHALLRQ